MDTIYLHHADTGQLAKIHGDKLTIIRCKSCGFTLPGTIAQGYEILTIAHVSSSYIEALCRTNISLAKTEWARKVSELINTLVQ